MKTYFCVNKKRHTLAALISITVFLAGLGVNGSSYATTNCTNLSASGDPSVAISEYAQNLVETGLTQTDVSSRVVTHFCLVRIAGKASGTVTPFSSARSSITFTTPDVFYDSSTKLYYSLTGWTWNNDSYKTELPTPLFATNNGNEDGFASYISGTPFAMGSSLSYGGAGCYFGATVDTSPTDNSSNGYAYLFQDKVKLNAGSYCSNSKTGQLSMTIQNPTTCQDITVKSKFVHTWSSATISAFNIGLSDISVTVTPATLSWIAASNWSPVFTIC